MPDEITHAQRERLLYTLAAGMFLLLFQSYMVAPIIPTLARLFDVSEQRAVDLIPVYMIPYGIAGVFIGALSDRFGRRAFLIPSLIAFPTLSLAMTFAPNLNTLLVLRAISGLTNAGIAVTTLTLAGDLFPEKERGRAMGWIFGAIAGGGAFGSTLGGVLAPSLGWRGLFALTAVLGLLVLLAAIPMWRVLGQARVPGAMPSIGSYIRLLKNSRASRTFAFIFLNAIFHGGMFAWIAVHLHERYGLGDVGVGLALLGYGVPGFLLGPIIGKVADRYGRRWIIPAGFAIAALSAVLFVPHWPLAAALIAATILSLGLDMSHPLLAGIVSMVDPPRRGQAMGLNGFSLFAGLGIGGWLFGQARHLGMSQAFLIFAAVQLTIGLIAIPTFRRE